MAGFPFDDDEEDGEGVLFGGPAACADKPPPPDPAAGQAPGVAKANMNVFANGAEDQEDFFDGYTVDDDDDDLPPAQLQAGSNSAALQATQRLQLEDGIIGALDTGKQASTAVDPAPAATPPLPPRAPKGMGKPPLHPPPGARVSHAGGLAAGPTDKTHAIASPTAADTSHTSAAPNSLEPTAAHSGVTMSAGDSPLPSTPILSTPQVQHPAVKHSSTPLDTTTGHFCTGLSDASLDQAHNGADTAATAAAGVDSISPGDVPPEGEAEKSCRPADASKLRQPNEPHAKSPPPADGTLPATLRLSTALQHEASPRHDDLTDHQGGGVPPHQQLSNLQQQGQQQQQDDPVQDAQLEQQEAPADPMEVDGGAAPPALEHHEAPGPSLPAASAAHAKQSPSLHTARSHPPTKAAAPTSTFSGFFPDTQTSGKAGTQGTAPAPATKAPLLTTARTRGAPRAAAGGHQQPKSQQGSASEAPHPPCSEQPSMPVSGSGADIGEGSRGSAPGSLADAGLAGTGAAPQVCSPSPPPGDASAAAAAAAAAAVTARQEGSQDVLDLSPIPLSSQDGEPLAPSATGAGTVRSTLNVASFAAAPAAAAAAAANEPLPGHAAASAAATAVATPTAPQPAPNSVPSAPTHTNALSKSNKNAPQLHAAHHSHTALPNAGSAAAATALASAPATTAAAAKHATLGAPPFPHAAPHTAAVPRSTIDTGAGRLQGSGSKMAPLLSPGSEYAAGLRPNGKHSSDSSHHLLVTTPASPSGQPNPASATNEPALATGTAPYLGSTDPVPEVQLDALDFSTSLSRLEKMLLQAQEMQLDVLEARTQSAMLANKLVRLDNPILRARLSQVAKQHAAATRMRLPGA